MKRKARGLWAILLIGILALFGCAGRSTAIPTATQRLVPTPPPTNTLLPTNTPSPTSTPRPPRPTNTPTVQPTPTLSPNAPPQNVGGVPRISPEDLKRRLDSGEAILVIDVRSADSFEAQHIPGALSVPLDQVGSRLNEFPRDQETVFY